ncbi:unnamed protein product [Rotaria sp. Silwood2]|nr:unnamed protein product [Rotaria sp. Silwood2]
MQLIFNFLVFVNLINIFYALVCPIYRSHKKNLDQQDFIEDCHRNCQFRHISEKRDACLGVYYNYSGNISVIQLGVIYSDEQCLTSKQCILDIDSQNPQSFSCCCSSDNCTLHWQIYKQMNILIWKNEVSLLKSIKHESIIKILSEGQYSSHLYLVLPFYENGTLQSYLLTTNRKLSINQCLVFLRSLASAISYLHMGRNSTHMTIVHRDIKSSNILIDKNELNLYLTDFGVALTLPQILTEKDFVQIGTIRYMAPELLEGVISHTREALCSVDMYALALVMWEIITQCDVYPTTVYRPPYEEYRTNSSNRSSFATEIYDIVVVRRLRPTLVRQIQDNQHSLIIHELCSLIDACWITDSDMRMNAQTLAFKLNQLI